MAKIKHLITAGKQWLASTKILCGIKMPALFSCAFSSQFLRLNLLAFLFSCLLAFFSSCQSKDKNERKIDMTPTFSPTDKNPLGMYVANQLLKQKFKDYDVEKSNKPFSEFYKDYTKYDYNRTGNVYCVMAQQFYTNNDDIDAISDFVSNGNTLFVAANYFDTGFLNKFHLTIRGDVPITFQLAYHMDMQQTGVKMVDSLQFNTTLYSYYFFPLSIELTRDDHFSSKIIAENETGKPSGLVFSHGNGRIIVVTNAAALTNYFLLTGINYKYIQNLLAYTPEKENSLKGDDNKNISTTGITLDTYYNTLDEPTDSDGAFSQLLKKPALKWAFCLLLLLAALWIYNGLIRRQRIIEVIKPNTNSSVEFAETVARLYLLKKDNKNIALKMITYFLEQVRNKYYLNTANLNREFAEALTAKTGQPIERSETLLLTIANINAQDSIGDHALLDLNTQLKRFLK